MRVKSTKKIKSKTKNSNQLELTFRENIKNKKILIMNIIKVLILFLEYF